jgi:hypothetical protein
LPNTQHHHFERPLDPRPSSADPAPPLLSLRRRHLSFFDLRSPCKSFSPLLGAPLLLFDPDTSTTEEASLSRETIGFVDQSRSNGIAGWLGHDWDFALDARLVRISKTRSDYDGTSGTVDGISQLAAPVDRVFGLSFTGPRSCILGVATDPRERHWRPRMSNGSTSDP